MLVINFTSVCVCGVPADLNDDNFVKVEFFLQNLEVNLLDS